MNTQQKPFLRWPLIVSYVGIITLMLACAGTAIGSTSDQMLQIDDGVVEVKDENGDWVPVAGDATFELTGELESTDPWTVAGRTLETNESTQISEGLQVGDLVRVQGAVLEGDTWVAYSIAPAEQQTDPILILIGVVDSVDPWVVNGIELNVTETTEIQGDITPGMIVRVEILLLEGGTWEVLSIAPLGDSTETPGCATIIATVVSVNGNEIQFLGWPTTVILESSTGNENDQENDNNDNEEDNANENENQNEENGNESDENEANENDNGAGSDNGGTIQPGQTVLAVVCVSDNNILVIVNIIVLNIDDEGGDPSSGGEKVLVCHKPNNKKGGHTISISSSAVPAHLGHGDTMGPCP
ncbi:MAG TPA: DUF5666 domain-containing protein [Anaerolineales bacterium]|nr:DUF5666 domain-containing protein [Anaerolineales bacterium]